MLTFQKGYFLKSLQLKVELYCKRERECQRQNEHEYGHFYLFIYFFEDEYDH
jgi:hypothetical protein